MRDLSPLATHPQQGRHVDAGSQLLAWASTETGQQTWTHVCPSLCLERIAHALRNALASRYGLLLWVDGALIWSTFSREQFASLQDRYEHIIATGLCFWWDGTQLERVSSERFRRRLGSLPRPGH